MATTPLWAAAQLVELRTAAAPQPFLVLRPRCSYITEAVPAALAFFEWPEGTPWELRISGLGWTVPQWTPLGLLADCAAAASAAALQATSTLTIEIRAAPPPAAGTPPRPLPLYDVRELFFQSIKQSLFLRAGSASGAVCMPLPEQEALWGAVADGQDVAVLDSLFKLSMYAGVAAPDAAALGNAEFLHVSLSASVLRPDGLRAAAAAAELAALRAVPIRLVVVEAGGGAAAEAPPAAWLRIVQRRVAHGASLADALRLLLPSPPERWPAALAATGVDGVPAEGAGGGAAAWRILVHGIDVCTPAAPAPVPALRAPAAATVAVPPDLDSAADVPAEDVLPSSSSSRHHRARGPSLTAAEGGVTYVFHPLASPSDSSVAGSADSSPVRLSSFPAAPVPSPPGPPGPARRGVSAGTIGGESYDTGRSALSADDDPTAAAAAAAAPVGDGASGGLGSPCEAGGPAPPLLSVSTPPGPEPLGGAEAETAAAPPPRAPPLLAASAAQLWQDLRYPDGWLYLVAVAPPPAPPAAAAAARG